MDNWWLYPNTTHCHGDKPFKEHVECNTNMMSSDQTPYETMQTEGCSQVEPSFEVNEVDQTEVNTTAHAYSLQHSEPSAEVYWGAAPQGFREHVSKVTFGTGGAYTPVGPPYSANSFAPVEAMNDLSFQANPHGLNESQVWPNTSDGCIDSRRLTLTGENYDQPQSERQQGAAVYSKNIFSDLGSSDLPHLQPADSIETYNSFQYPQEQFLGSTPSLGPHSSIDQMMEDKPTLPASVQMPTELRGVPFAPTRRPSTVPWSHTAAIEQTMPHGVYNEGPYLDRLNSHSTGETSLGEPDHDGSMVTDIVHEASTNSSWAPDVNPTDSGGMALYPRQSATPHTIRRRRSSYRHGSGGLYEPRSDDPYTREHFDTMLDRLDINSGAGTELMRSRSERLVTPRNTAHRRKRASPGPSDVSTTSSVTWTPMACRVEGCETQFTGQFGRGNLSRHLRSVHNRREFPCKVRGCYKIYKRQDALKKHCDRRHTP